MLPRNKNFARIALVCLGACIGLPSLTPAAQIAFDTAVNPVVNTGVGLDVSLPVYVRAATGNDLAAVGFDLTEVGIGGGDVTAISFTYAAPNPFPTTNPPGAGANNLKVNQPSFLVENARGSDLSGNYQVHDQFVLFGMLNMTATAQGTVQLFFAKDSQRWGEANNGNNVTNPPMFFGFGDAAIGFPNTGTGSSPVGANSTQPDATIEIVPEPGSLALLGAAVCVAGLRRRRD